MDESPAAQLYQDYDLDNPVVMETGGKFYAQNRWEASDMTREFAQWFDYRGLDSSRKMNSSRKVGNNSMRKVIFRGKLNSSRRKLSSSRNLKYTPYSTSNLGTLEDEWGYDKGELVDLVKDGEKQIGGKFLGFTSDDDMYFVFEEDGKPMAYEQSHDRWFPVDSSRKPASKGTRKKLNSSSENSLYAKYYNRFNSMNDAIKSLSAHVDEADALPDWVAETEGNGYGKVVGFYIGKDAYFDVLDENNMSILFVLDDGTVGRQFGRNFYQVSKEFKELIDMELLPNLDSSRKLNSSEGESDDDADAGESVGEGADAPASEGETEVQDTGVEGGEDTAETAEILENALIVQNPETKEVALFVADADDETVPEDVDVIAEVEAVADVTEVLDSSRRLKKFATAKLNSSKGCLNSDADVCPGCGKPYDECECEPGTVAYDEIQLPDDTVVEVENILVVQDDEGELGLFMPEDAEEAVPEGYEVVATATPAAEADVLDSSRRMKKSNAKKLNSSAKKNR